LDGGALGAQHYHEFEMNCGFGSGLVCGGRLPNSSVLRPYEKRSDGASI